MQNPARFFARLALAVALTAPAAACTVRGGAWLSGPRVVVVEESPPPPRHETIVVRPGYIWISGHWSRDSGSWVWVDGHHERKRADKIWVPGRWEKRSKGHVWIAGKWRVKHNHGRGRG